MLSCWEWVDKSFSYRYMFTRSTPSWKKKRVNFAIAFHHSRLWPLPETQLWRCNESWSTNSESLKSKIFFYFNLWKSFLEKHEHELAELLDSVQEDHWGWVVQSVQTFSDWVRRDDLSMIKLPLNNSWNTFSLLPNLSIQLWGEDGRVDVSSLQSTHMIYKKTTTHLFSVFVCFTAGLWAIN